MAILRALYEKQLDGEIATLEEGMGRGTSDVGRRAGFDQERFDNCV
jgi:hypothetical protein